MLHAWNSAGKPCAGCSYYKALEHGCSRAVTQGYNIRESSIGAVPALIGSLNAQEQNYMNKTE